MNAPVTITPRPLIQRPRNASALRRSISCPHCAGDAKLRSSRSITALFRQLYFQCQDIDCGCTFVAELAITHEIVPSQRPDPSVHLRRAPPRPRPGVNAPGESRPADAGNDNIDPASVSPPVRDG